MVNRLVKFPLDKLTASGNWYRRSLMRAVLITEGAKQVGDTYGAYWLLEEIAVAQKTHRGIAGATRQVWTLQVAREGTACLTCQDRLEDVAFFTMIQVADVALNGIGLWFSDNVIRLPFEC